LRWSAYYLVLRVAMGAAFFVGAGAAARWVGVWFTLPMAACTAAMVCGFVAIKLNQTGGRVSYINQLAVIVFPVGRRSARGRLLPMFAWSAGLWSTIEMAGAIYGGVWSHGMDHASTHALLLRVLLIVSLFVDAASFVLLILQAVRRLSPKSPTMIPVGLSLAALLVLIVGGVGLWMAGLPWAAVLLAGGPPVIVAGIYSVFVVRLFASHPR
jgi:hypothetical protein